MTIDYGPGDWSELVRIMKSAQLQLAILPEDRAWTQDELEMLDDVRMTARRLFDEATSCIEVFEGL